MVDAEPVIREAKVTSESRGGRTWNTLSGRIETFAPASVEELWAVITDWDQYPRLFPKIQKVEAVKKGDTVLLSETVVVSALGVSVTNRFTLRLELKTDPVTGSRSIPWTQAWADGTIDHLEGRWDLEPGQLAGQRGTWVRYRTQSSVIETIPGQAAFVGMFYAGELKQIINAVVDETRKRKEAL